MDVLYYHRERAGVSNRALSDFVPYRNRNTHGDYADSRFYTVKQACPMEKISCGVCAGDARIHVN